MKNTSILFVCMANYCRSPTAEGVFRARALQAGLAERLHIDSAGTHNYRIGDQPDPRSSAFAAQRGYDLSALRARQVADEDFAAFDHILAMDDANLASLRQACPAEHQHKLGLFMQYASRSDSTIVPDPYQGDDGGFDMVLDFIEDASDGLLDHLRKDHKDSA
jgi:protein-tyrosine phosphatase